MEERIIAIDQSTSATKAMLFTPEGALLKRINIEHTQYYPQQGWVEHNACEIYDNTVKAVSMLLENEDLYAYSWSVAITNQRETVVVWDRTTGSPCGNAIVWQCVRGAEICKNLKDAGHEPIVREKTGLMIDPYFSASGVKWILDNVEGAREKADRGDLMLGTIESWLIWRLSGGKDHVCDYTNAGRTLLFNIKTLSWDAELLDIFTIPYSMLPKPLPSDSVFAETTFDGLFENPIKIAGVLGDSHGALAGQMCFSEGMGKATYGTGSSIMINIGDKPLSAPAGTCTTVAFSAFGKTYYAYEGNIHCTGATIKWLADKLGLIESPKEIERIANLAPDNGGVYFVPAFAGLGAPWWNSNAKAAIVGMTLASGKPEVCRAAIESIAFQIKDLIDAFMADGMKLSELRVDGGPTRNNLLMQFQSDVLQVPVNRAPIEEASAFGAFIMNGIALGRWKSVDEIVALRKESDLIVPAPPCEATDKACAGWRNAIRMIQQ